jgi:hypothetical protein
MRVAAAIPHSGFRLAVVNDLLTATYAGARLGDGNRGFAVRIIAALALTLTLAGCATQTQMADARKVWADCVMNAVIQLDDGKSDPVSIAYGVSPMCAVQYERLSGMLVSQAITDSGQAYARQLMKDDEVKMVTSAVLTYRASRTGKATTK